MPLPVSFRTHPGSTKRRLNWHSPRPITADEVGGRGYDPNDFSFFPEQKRTELTRIVDHFRKIAGEVNPRDSATEQQIGRARPLFRSIVEMLEFDRFADVDAFRVGNIVEAEPMFPSSDVSDNRYRTKIDSNDYPALKIMVCCLWTSGRTRRCGPSLRRYTRR